MDEKRDVTDRLGGLEGADAAGLGTGDPPAPAPPGATVDADERLVPGADHDLDRGDEAKPWFTSLAAKSEQAGVGNDPPDAQEPQFPSEAKDQRS